MLILLAAAAAALTSALHLRLGGRLAMTVLLVACASCDAASAPPATGGAGCVDRCIQQRPAGCALDIPTCAEVCAEGGSPDVSAARPTTRAARGNGRSPGPALLASTIDIETAGGVATPLIARCSLLPFELVETFSTAEDDQATVQIHMLSGENRSVAENRSLGRFALEGIRPAPHGVPVIEVTMAVNRAGVLSLSARDRDTRQAVSIVALSGPGPGVR